MSNEAELQEVIDYLEGEVSALESELDDIKKKAAKNTNSYKAKLKAQAKSLDASRLKELAEATKGADALSGRAKEILVAARADARSPTVGLGGRATAQGKIDVIEELFDVV